jgi:hypothetical protein
LILCGFNGGFRFVRRQFEFFLGFGDGFSGSGCISGCFDLRLYRLRLLRR